MGNEPNRPTTVPAEATWESSDNEWALGETKSGKKVGEWKWWLAPNGHLVCESMFDGAGSLLTFKRYHPNGEVSRYGTFKDGKTVEDVFLASTEPTTEHFAYGRQEGQWKAVRRDGFPISYDYYDKNGKHLNPELEAVTLRGKELDTAVQAAVVKQLQDTCKSAKRGDLDESFAEQVPVLVPQREDAPDAVVAMMDEFLEWDADVFYHKGDLHLSDLAMGEEIGVLVVEGNLKVDNSVANYDDPMSILVVTGNLDAGNIVVSGGLFVGGDVVVHGAVFGDYNHGFAVLAGDLKAKFFYPEEYFFSVGGTSTFEIAFGNGWRLNNNATPEKLSANEMTVRELCKLLHPDVQKQLNLDNDAYLDDPCSEQTIWEYVDRHGMMDYVRAGNPLLK